MGHNYISYLAVDLTPCAPSNPLLFGNAATTAATSSGVVTGKSLIVSVPSLQASSLGNCGLSMSLSAANNNWQASEITLDDTAKTVTFAPADATQSTLLGVNTFTITITDKGDAQQKLTWTVTLTVTHKCAPSLLATATSWTKPALVTHSMYQAANLS